jgi:hypothetical protein
MAKKRKKTKRAATKRRRKGAVARASSAKRGAKRTSLATVRKPARRRRKSGSRSEAGYLGQGFVREMERLDATVRQQEAKVKAEEKKAARIEMLKEIRNKTKPEIDAIKAEHAGKRAEAEAKYKIAVAKYNQKVAAKIAELAEDPVTRDSALDVKVKYGKRRFRPTGT